MKNKSMILVGALVGLLGLGGCATQTAIDNYGRTMKAVSPNGDKVVYGYALQAIGGVPSPATLDPVSAKIPNPEYWEILLRNGFGQLPAKSVTVAPKGSIVKGDIVAIKLPNTTATSTFISVAAKPDDPSCYWDGSVWAYSLDAGVICPKHNWNYKSDLGFAAKELQGLRLVDKDRNVIPFPDHK